MTKAEYLAEGTEHLLFIRLLEGKTPLVHGLTGLSLQTWREASTASSALARQKCGLKYGWTGETFPFPQTIQMNVCLQSWEMSGISEKDDKELQINALNGHNSQSGH